MPKFFPLVREVYAFVGEDITVPPFVHLTISCSHLISTLVLYNITWSVNGDIVTNNSVPNATIEVRQHLIITSTLLTVDGQFGSGGIYACTVCSDNGTCIERQSRCEICGKPKLCEVKANNFNCMTIEIPRLEKAPTPVTKISSNTDCTLQCGENLCISSIASPPFNFTIIINCTLLHSVSTNRYELNVYRDNLFYSNESIIILTEEEIFDNLGTYKTVLNDSCGMDMSTSVLSLCGKLQYMYIHIV